ncbi:MAG: Unknown protein [uncultured Thiotrichaceae bacterium]|uniref:Uncharacterized protein n=1 Tax=uncultured Thiotrichaceae bacterium TaxID=298394 RepID=A0A6S6TUZ7_9GAMM|nr:MAG: Unknown protein [uncultured Thiotrichaceae bacterium]
MSNECISAHYLINHSTKKSSNPKLALVNEFSMDDESKVMDSRII